MSAKEKKIAIVVVLLAFLIWLLLRSIPAVAAAQQETQVRSRITGFEFDPDLAWTTMPADIVNAQENG
jgi:hypothetical protein